jgi:nucleoside-diphosphate-sugar epimerase
MTKNTVLVTGAGGFIGRYLTKELEERYSCDVHEFKGDIFSTCWETYLRSLEPSYLVNLAWTTGAGYLDSNENLLFVQKSIELYDAFFVMAAKGRFLSAPNRSINAARFRCERIARSNRRLFTPNAKPIWGVCS